MRRPRGLWIAVGVTLVALAWLSFRSAPAAQDAGDSHSDHGHDDHHAGAGDGPTAQITVWTDQFEIFAEHPLAVVGEPVRFIVHVTDQQTFLPRTEGPAKFILRHGGTARATHVEPTPARPGIYTPELTFSLPAEWTVAVAIPHADGEHVVELPPLHVYASAAETSQAPEPPKFEGVEFLKEQQWRVPVWNQAVQHERIGGREVPTIPASVVVRDGAEAIAFVQVAGEVYQKRSVELGQREGDRIEILSGLEIGEHVATRGATEILAAAHAQEDGHHASHDHDAHNHAIDEHSEDDHDAHDHASTEHGEDDHDAHDHGATEHDDHGHGPEPIRFSADDIKRYSIEIGAAQAGCVTKALTLTGEIRLNRDRMAQIVPRMTGIALEIRKNLGDPVHQGEVLAVIESRPLADAKADYLAACERTTLAEAVYTREERLRQQEISSEQEYLDARQALSESNLLLRAARQKLLAMGFTEEYLEKLPGAPDNELTRLEIIAPFDGTVIEKEVTLGERVSDETPVFVVADLSTVWLDLYAHERDVGNVRRGQHVALVARAGTPAAAGTIDYTHPIADETTRTVLVRAVLDNPVGKLRPGTFVTARVATDELTSCVTIDRDAVQYLSDEPFIFVYAEGEFTPRSVTLGKSDDRCVEVVGGVRPGEALATRGSFRLKAEIEKRTVGDVGHGHAH